MISEQALKDRLQTIAKEKEIRFNACWKQLLLERFLARLSRSSYVDKTGLKALQQLWTAHLRGLGDIAKELDLPEKISEAIDTINLYRMQGEFDQGNLEK